MLVMPMSILLINLFLVDIAIFAASRFGIRGTPGPIGPSWEGKPGRGRRFKTPFAVNRPKTI
jgi:hypothetical protein